MGSLLKENHGKLVSRVHGVFGLDSTFLAPLMDSFHLSNIELSKTSPNFNCCFQISLMCFPVIAVSSFGVFLFSDPSDSLFFPSAFSCSNANKIKCCGYSLFSPACILRFMRVVYHLILSKVCSVWLFCLFLHWNSKLVAVTIFPESFYTRL